MSYPVRLPSDAPVVTVTQPSPYQWVLELHNGADNRLGERVLREGLGPALDLIERDWRESTAKLRKAKDEKAGAGSLIITGQQEKFFSNGFELEDIQIPWFIRAYYNPIIIRLLSFPIPVVAALNGHTFAAGFCLAMACDYRVMKSQKAWASMNEIHFGAPLPRGFVKLFNEKAANANLVRKVFLEGHRFTAQELIKEGLIDEVVEGDATKVREAAQALGNKLAPLSRTGVYGLQKEEIYRAIIQSAEERPMQVLLPEDHARFVDAQRAKL
ncbi:ClpP/crotonase [Auriculariales sp. MPI-PUGE-AT-0066]|nr:ClpP/crotonase [Auriculariales sp. MPI-PUGE-AT-0066]